MTPLTGEAVSERIRIQRSSDLKFLRSDISGCNFRRRGMTLVELLVVLVIVLLLAAATIPRLKPEIDRSRVREAARSIQLYLSSARNQAMATGRLCGVMIERLAAENGCSMSLTQVETPCPTAEISLNSIGHGQAAANTPNNGLCRIATLPSRRAAQRSAVSGRSDPDRLSRFLDYLGYPEHDQSRNGRDHELAADLTGYVDTTHGETPRLDRPASHRTLQDHPLADQVGGLRLAASLARAVST